MINNISAISLQILQDGLLTFIIGLLVTFLGIGIIVCFVWLFGYVFSKGNKKVETVENKNEVNKPATLQNSNEIPEHIKVAIISAITAYYASETKSAKKCEFVVKRIKKL